MRDCDTSTVWSMSVATFERLERIRRAPDRVAYKPAVRAQDGCVFDSTSRFMNAFVANRLMG